VPTKTGKKPNLRNFGAKNCGRRTVFENYGGETFIFGFRVSDPPTAPITTADNVTYTFTGNIYDSIVIERSNIIVNGSGYALQGSGAWESKGIDLTGRSNVTIKNIRITAFYYGIYLGSSSYNSISGNNIANNGYGIWLEYSSNNSIYHNNFVDNAFQVYTENSVNVWDDGYPSGGNYWSDYTSVDLYSGPYQNETGSDGIGDTLYTIDAYNRDNYPLMSPYEYWSNPMPGDVNKDKKVDYKDLFQFAAAYSSTPEKLNWNPNCDFNKDYKIEVLDLFDVGKNYGKTDP
jgi:parallel beta-helix repeat protein